MSSSLLLPESRLWVRYGGLCSYYTAHSYTLSPPYGVYTGPCLLVTIVTDSTETLINDDVYDSRDLVRCHVSCGNTRFRRERTRFALTLTSGVNLAVEDSIKLSAEKTSVHLRNYLIICLCDVTNIKHHTWLHYFWRHQLDVCFRDDLQVTSARIFK